ncbi:hypothetical protein [Arthrobacter sp. yr096]|uniref:hypothetical protein n=1 Tax=Arthrobacter sp. yr096 TaxID=1761750 RepID=UPI00115FE3D1|nr:hypothetical protein [Arthrobacter sp. yr096]
MPQYEDVDSIGNTSRRVNCSVGDEDEEKQLDAREPKSTADDTDAKGTHAIDPALIAKINSILMGQTSLAAAHVRKMRAKNPKLTPAAALKKLDRQLMATATAAGAASGAAGAAPEVGKAVSTAITLGGPAVSLPAAVFYILAVAEVHQIPLGDIEHRRTLVLSVVLEQGADSAIPKFAKRTGLHWTRKTLDAIPGSALKPFNNLIHPKFITKTGPTGTIVLNIVLPYALGAIVGASYSFATTSAVVGATKLAFGPPKAAFDDDMLEEDTAHG